MSDDEFGPWIDHDGKGCPVPHGTVVRCVLEHTPGDLLEEQLVAGGGEGWDWRFWRLVSPEDGLFYARIIRYRIKKPLGLTILEGLLADVTEREDA